MTSNTHARGYISVQNAVEATTNAWHAFNPYYYDGYTVRSNHTNASSQKYTRVGFVPNAVIPKGTKIRLRVYCTPEMLAHKKMKNGNSYYYPVTGCWLVSDRGGAVGLSIQHRDMTTAGIFYYKDYTLTDNIVRLDFSTWNSYGTTIWNNRLIMPNIILL